MKNNLTKNIFISLILCYFFIPLQAWNKDTIFIKKDFIYQSLSQEILYYEDKDGLLTQENIVEKSTALTFQKHQDKAINFGAIKSPYWFQIQLKNGTAEKQNLVLEVENTTINKIQLVQQKEDTVLFFGTTGDHLPFPSRPITSRHFAFPIQLNPNETVQYFLLLDSSNETLMSYIKLWDNQAFENKEAKENLIIGSLVGVSFFILLTATLLSIFLQIRIFWLYLAYLFFLTIALIAATGIGFEYLYPNNPYLHQILYLQATGIAAMTLTLFMIKAIHQTINITKWKPFFNVYLAYVGLAIIYAFFYDFIKHYPNASAPGVLAHALSGFNFALVAYLSFKVFLIRKDTVSFLLFFTTLFFIHVSLYTTLTFRGILPYTSMMGELNVIWTFFEIIIITTVMLVTIKNIYSDKLKLEKTLYLEKKKVVKEFISGQQQERQRLSQDLHDGISLQMTNIKARLAHYQLNQVSDKGNQELTDIIHAIGRTSNDIRNFSHALGSVTLQEFGLIPALEDLFLVLKHTYPSVKINHDLVGFSATNLPKDIELFIFHIVQELLNNVYKHAEANKILVSLENTQEEIKLKVLDNGKGYDPNKIQSKGLGLQNIRSRVLVMDGTFEIARGDVAGMKHLIIFPI